jgi:hypothetical protein
LEQLLLLNDDSHFLSFVHRLTADKTTSINGEEEEHLEAVTALDRAQQRTYEQAGIILFPYQTPIA